MLPLPIDPHLPAIVAAVKEHRGLVLVAEPGAGKTTRVPRALLDAGLAARGTILVVQPRRIAARMAAIRVAEELGEPVGRTVGYRVRFDAKVSAKTRVELVTEGILARRLVSDPTLEGVAALVFDELHERHLDTDVALARARRLRERARPDLQIVAMSATLEAEPVAAFLDAPVLSVEGRTFPIETRFDAGPDDRPLERRVRAGVVRLFDEGVDGDVLVFLPGASAIRRAMDACEGPAGAFGYDRVALHGDLPAADQDRAVRRGPRPKVIFSTNVAETSLTLEGVVAVVDSGLARRARVSPWTGLTRLEVAPVSRASAVQRAGRAGRTRPGVCVRLFTEADFHARPPRDRPEIERADLAATVLSLRAAGEDPRAFPWLEAPPAAALDAADTLLEKLGAVTEEQLTALGRAMLALPAHPRLARVALEAHRRGLTEAGARIAALIGERDIRVAARTRFGDGVHAKNDEVAASDVLVRLDELDALGPRPSAHAMRAAGLDPRAVAAVLAAARQLEQALRGIALPIEPSFDEEEALLLATLAGFPDRVAKRQRGRRLAPIGGGVAELDEASAVKDAALLVLVDADASGGMTRVRRASTVTLEHLMELFLDRIEETVEARFDATRERVIGVSQLRYEGLVVDESPREPGEREAARTLADAALARGIERFVDADALATLERRIAFAAAHDPSLRGASGPGASGSSVDAGEAALSMEEWRREVLERACVGRRSFAELRDAGLLEMMRAELGGGTIARLERLAPEHVAIPGRARVPVHYEVGRPPWIESRLQDFFGASEGPTVAGGRVPLVLHLLAPNKRAVQVTTDLAGFWDRHYDDVKKELRRRYPRHAWPDDPRTAAPSKPTPRRR